VAKVNNANKTTDLRNAPLIQVPKTTLLFFKLKTMGKLEKFLIVCALIAMTLIYVAMIVGVYLN
jgi:cell division protein FtsL